MKYSLSIKIYAFTHLCVLCIKNRFPRLQFTKKYKCFQTMVIYTIKQDIRIYVHFSRPNGWTEWAELFFNSRALCSLWASKAKKCCFFYADHFSQFKLFCEEKKLYHILIIIVSTIIFGRMNIIRRQTSHFREIYTWH